MATLNRETGILLVVISVFICGCPGVFLCLGSGAFTLVSTNDPALSNPIYTFIGLALVMVGIMLTFIPIMGIFVTRNLPRRAKETSPAELEEELPPAI